MIAGGQPVPSAAPIAPGNDRPTLPGEGSVAPTSRSAQTAPYRGLPHAAGPPLRYLLRPAPPSLAEEIAVDLALEVAAPEAPSDREHEVLVRLGAGAAVDEIVEQLGPQDRPHLSLQDSREDEPEEHRPNHLLRRAQWIGESGRGEHRSCTRHRRDATATSGQAGWEEAMNLSAVGASTLLVFALAARSEADLAEIRARGSLRVITHLTAVDSHFSTRNPSRPGLDLEILQSFARLEKLRLEIVEVSGGPDLRVAALVEGKGDVVGGRLAISAARSRRIAFSAEIFPLRFVMLTRHPSPALTTSAELRGYRVGTVGTSEVLMAAVEAAQVPPSDVDASFKEPSDMRKGLRSGRVTAIITSLDEALTAKSDDPQMRIGGFVGAPNSFVFGLRKEDAALRTALDSYIGNLRKTASWNQLIVKYYGNKALELLRNLRGGEKP
jgi:lysine/arginine/ornithine transport system substrate-binding protein